MFALPHKQRQIRKPPPIKLWLIILELERIAKLPSKFPEFSKTPRRLPFLLQIRQNSDNPVRLVTKPRLNRY